MTQGRSDSLLLIGNHGHADSSTADQDPSVAHAIYDFPADCLGVIRIINGICGVCSQVFNIMTEFLQQGHNNAL